MNISLPGTLKAWVEEQVASGGYATVSEFFRELLRAEQQRRLREHIDANLHQALDSGKSTPMTPVDGERIRQEGRKRIAEKRKKR